MPFLPDEGPCAVEQSLTMLKSGPAVVAVFSVTMSIMTENEGPDKICFKKSPPKSLYKKETAFVYSILTTKTL